MRAIVVGWFSYINSDSTAGDWLASDLVCEWLNQAGLPWDLAVAAPFTGGVSLDRVNAADYTHAIFVCGPFMRNGWEASFLGKFARCAIIGVNLSLPVPLHAWNPFDYLVERDSSHAANPDVTFASSQPLPPVIGICLVEPYDGALVQEANARVRRFVDAREMSLVHIDTRLDVNSTGLRTKGEVEAVLARMDAVITTRLHGTVLSLKNGVPAVAIDPEPPGGKITRQAQVIGWPVVINISRLDDATLAEGLAFCLSPDGRARARRCAERASLRVNQLRDEFIRQVGRTAASQRKVDERLVFALNHGWSPEVSR